MSPLASGPAVDHTLGTAAGIYLYTETSAPVLPFATAHAITAPFIITPAYGTRCSSIVRADSNGRWQLLERRFDAQGKNIVEAQFSFRSGED